MPDNNPTPTDKPLAAQALGQSPSTPLPLAIDERVAILAGLHRGQRDIDSGRLVTQEAAKRMSAAWLE